MISHFSGRAIFMAVSILFTAIFSGGCASKPEEAAPEIIERQMVLSSSSEASREAYAPESPAIDDEPELPAAEEEPESAAGEAEESAPAIQESPGQNVIPQSEPAPASSGAAQDGDKPESRSERAASYEAEAVRAVWISYLDLEKMLLGGSRAGFDKSVAAAFDNVKALGLNTVYVHVRPFGDALYASDYFPWSYLCTGEEGADPGFDPLAVMVSEAKKRGLRIEAWVNPYRVRAAGSRKALSSGNPARIWLEEGGPEVKDFEGVISYNPASEAAQELIINGAREIVANYAVDGIHIDDYFYPHTDPGFDSRDYAAYKSEGGGLSLEDWRRQNVLTLIKGMYSAIKEEREDAVFGISPQSNISTNYNLQYLDVEEVVSKSGYCDYICPQVYFGFENAVQPFAETMKRWSDMVRTDTVELYAGLAVYKAGLTDGYAGEGKAEWQNNRDLISRMVEYARSLPYYNGFVLYRYDSLFNPEANVKDHIAEEIDNLRSALVS
ncbi:hypothetical protein FACS1894191_2650 [Clostridia bacterium]|nr:hypothetical protein FACS1894191_2650 [Clostridia bacterium]